MDNSDAPYCVVVGRVGTDPLYVLGPYPDDNSAQADADQYPHAYVDRLISPQAQQQGAQQ